MRLSRLAVGLVLGALASSLSLTACQGGPGSIPTEQSPPDNAGDGGPPSPEEPPDQDDCSTAGCALPPKCNPDGTPGPAPRCSCGCTPGQVVVEGMICTDRGCLAPIPDAGDDAGDGGDGGA